MGASRVAQLVAGLWAKAAAGGAQLEPALVNGQPGLLARDGDGRLISVLTVDVLDDGSVATVRSVVNPEKLGHLGPLSDWARRDPRDQGPP